MRGVFVGGNCGDADGSGGSSLVRAGRCRKLKLAEVVLRGPKNRLVVLHAANGLDDGCWLGVDVAADVTVDVAVDVAVDGVVNVGFDVAVDVTVDGVVNVGFDDSVVNGVVAFIFVVVHIGVDAFVGVVVGTNHGGLVKENIVGWRVVLSRWQGRRMVVEGGWEVFVERD